MELERKNPNRNQNRNPDLELVLRDALATDQ